MLTDLYDKVVPLSHESKFKSKAEKIGHFLTSSEQEHLAELLEFYSLKPWGFPIINFDKFSDVMLKTYFSLRKNGYIMGITSGTVGWDWKWLDSNVTDPTPKTVTMNALKRANGVYPVYPDRISPTREVYTLGVGGVPKTIKLELGEYLLTHDWKLHS